jgi:hypothetical protein
MASRRRPTSCEPCTYDGPALDPNRALLRRVFFLNDEKSRYVSVGFYPAHNYQPLVEFGGTRIRPLVLPVDYVNIVVERLPDLVESMHRNESFVWRSEDKVFKMHSTRSLRIARFTNNKQWISIKLQELRNLHYIFHIITNTLFMYTEALGDVRAYVNAALASSSYVEPPPTASKLIIYRQLFDELKSPVY